jgi:hypothetical protein
MKQEPPLDTKCKDKFLVQSVAITGDKEFTNLASIWDSIEKSQVQERKIRVVFLSPAGGSGAAHLETPSKPTLPNGNDATPDVAPPAYSSPGDFAVESVDGKQDTGSPVVAAASATSRNTEPSYEELKQQLVQAEKLITQLKQDQGGLRQRKAAGSDDKPSKTAELAQQVRAGTEGVPVNITAILCFVSFLLAYLFF